MLAFFPLIVYTFVSAIIVNFFRFKGSRSHNKLLLIFSGIALVEVDGFLFNFTQTKWFVLVFIGMLVLCYRSLGGLISVILAWLILYYQANERNLFTFYSYVLFAISARLLLTYIRKMKFERNRHLSNLIGIAKQLNVFKEISFSMQQTLQLQKLLQTILTSVTAGYGLGFNRAMILLMDDEGTALQGIMGTGPMSTEEGYATWERITKYKYKLIDLIEIKETEGSSDHLLNERVKKLNIPLDQSHFLKKALESGNPLHLNEINENDQVQLLFAREFNMFELAVFPLIYQGIKLGVLIIDNPVNKKPITADDLDSVIPLANQAAIAIQNTRLYAQVEDMALKDGLTGLFNQRAFQRLIGQHFPTSNQDSLSLIILDIDNFKHFNDTNGHMMGNQVLIQLADVIRKSIRKDDLAFRFGGEEFVILLPHTVLEQATDVAEQIRLNVERTDFPCGEKQPQGRLTISLGISSTIESPSTDGLVIAADQALYWAKDSGKNKVGILEGTSKP